MKEITADSGQVSFCGLYCGACKRFLKEKCPGCEGNEKASWCEIRICCQENNFKSCADCTFFDDVNNCKKFNNFISKICAFIFRSDRKKGIEFIKNNGLDQFAMEMASKKIMTIKK